MSESPKIKRLKDVLAEAEEGKSILRIIRLQGSFQALLVKKRYKNNGIVGIEVKTLENNNPEYEKNTMLTLNLADGGLGEIEIVEFK